MSVPKLNEAMQKGSAFDFFTYFAVTMRRVIWLLLPLICSAWIQSGNTILLDIHGIRNSKGRVLVSVFDKAGGFPDDPAKAVRTLQLPVQDGHATTHLTGLAEGEYAIAVMHDENNDGKLNTNWIGIPKEGFGFSNNVMGVFGPPSFQKAKLILKQNKLDTKIRMKYL